jgi:methyl-accepting chemotaxis protein
MLARRFADTRIAVKVMVAPLLLVMSMAVLAIIFQVGMHRQASAVAELHDVSFARNTFVARMGASATSIQANAYRLLGWSSAGMEKSKLQALEARIRADIATLSKDTADFAALAREGEETDLVRVVGATVYEFSRSAKDVIDMASIDPVTALVLMTATEQTYDRLTGSVGRLAEFTAKGTGEVYAQALSVAADAKLQYYGVLALVLVTGGLAVFAMGRLIARPVVEMTAVMGRLANNETDLEVPSRDRGDEIGGMARAVAVFRDSIIRAGQLEVENRAAAKASADRAARRETLTESFNNSMEHLLETVMHTVRQVHTNSDGLQSNATRTSEQGAAVAVAAEQASANVNTVAAATEQLGGSVREISSQLATTVAITNDAVTNAQTANTTITSLDENAKRISEVVTLINNIASQTNLLALNATIEAARAGDAGKGFAVVANEVKSLANQTAKATDEIAAQIASVQGATRDAVESIRSIGGIIDRVSEIVGSIASAVEQQSAATQEIARNVQQAAAGNDEITTNIAHVSQAASETGTMASAMFSAANELLGEAETLRAEVSTFLADMRR